MRFGSAAETKPFNLFPAIHDSDYLPQSESKHV